jgi:MSHA biogenesis protein MshI
MSLTSKLKELLIKSDSKNKVGVAMQQQGLAVCYIAENQETGYQQLLLTPEGFVNTMSLLTSEQQMSGACTLVLSSDKYQIVQVDKPNVPDAELLGALKWQIKDLVSIAPDDMVLDYFSSPVALGSAEKINVVCAKLSELKEMVDQLNKGKLKLNVITTEEFAFAQLVAPVDEAHLLVCQQPGQEILLLVVKNSQLHFHRRLRGYSQLASMDEYQLGAGKLDSLSLEIQRSTDYFERQLKQSPIKAIQILLPIEQEQFCARKLAENTNLPVNLLTLPEEHNDQRGYAVAIGATQLLNMEQVTSG